MPWSLEMFSLFESYFINKSGYKVWFYPSGRFSFITNISPSYSSSPLASQRILFRSIQEHPFYRLRFSFWFLAHLLLLPHILVNLYCPFWAARLTFSVMLSLTNPFLLLSQTFTFYTSPRSKLENLVKTKNAANREGAYND